MKVWRRSYDTPPPADRRRQPARTPTPTRRYASLPPDVLPQSECLDDVVDRMLPYWFDDIVPDLRGRPHRPRRRPRQQPPGAREAPRRHRDADIAGLDIPTGVPLVYELDDDFRPVEAKPVLDRALGDPEAIKAAADAVAKQASGG